MSEPIPLPTLAYAANGPMPVTAPEAVAQPAPTRATAAASTAFVSAGNTGQQRDEAAAEPEDEPTEAAVPALPELPPVPAFLLLSERSSRIVGTVAGLGLGVVTSFAAYHLSPSGSVLERIFDPSSAATLIPLAIVSLFLVGCVLVLLRAQRLRAGSRIAHDRLSLTIAQAIEAHGPAAVASWLEAPVSQASPLLRRVQSVVGQWLLSPGLAEADLALQHHVVADAENLQAAYSLPRTIVWALPVLGLIGTVIGIAAAVGGFADFLGGSVDDIVVVKRNLVGVTGGLSFAFLITLLGLATALVLMFLTSAVQAREESFLTRLQGCISERILPALQRAHPVPLPTMPAFGGDGFLAALRQEMRNGARFMGQIFSRTGEEVTQLLANDRHVRETAVEIGAALLRRELTAAAAEVAQSGERAAQHMADATIRLVAESEAVLRTVAGQTDELRAMLATLAAGIATQTSTLAEISYTLPEALNAQVDALREAGASATALAGSVRESIAAVQEMHIGPALDNVADQVATQCRETQSAATTIKNLTEATLALAACHTAVQEGIQSLRELRLNEALSEVGQGLEKIGPVLERFQQPFVLTAVPVQMPAQHAG
ncbi:MotA/TolQ/ExbB proton channel family protein [Accumulibacter sp.]|uniref:MotA/TolQ/ExbB proton channel family protein n=1 Tax=Accumulibacter sp. TaxID=2053492 RepID=UPI0025ECB3BE|nr:MotA/TolQ/ExbB proton channel family protein [Accumulibacter sp.]MCM8595571.1 MotA/TolQ/ExbB proton channel family protein [Accumulibacter sp.]MCM8625058.1 MotA/TolQ/ExbB proton channel family protein [Accumulibacter sp.]MDS4049719.1 MotA/TolQ/ExbB proton channel family protein [Accumulibacter sp.]